MKEKIRLISFNAHLEEDLDIPLNNELDLDIEADVIQEKQSYLFMFSFEIRYQEFILLVGNMVYSVKESYLDDVMTKYYLELIQPKILDLLHCLVDQSYPNRYKKR